LGHLDFDIVSDFDTPVRSVCIHIRISDFASLGIFTLVESALQIRPFMQNEPNFRKAKMNVYTVITKDYERNDIFAVQKNKPNSNPILSAVGGLKMNVNSLITKDYRKKDDFAVRKNKAKTNPILIRAKMNLNFYLTKDYKNERFCRCGENKPNQTQKTHKHSIQVVV